VLIPEELLADSFGQNPVKRGVCLEVLILREIEKIENETRNWKYENRSRPSPSPVIAEECATL
jgi:hypothetical protein